MNTGSERKSRYKNLDTPINDLERALGSLIQGDRTVSYLKEMGGDYFIEINHSGGFYDMEIVHVDRYLIIPTLAQEMKTKGFIELDHRYDGIRFRITSYGKSECEILHSIRMKEARARLIPGVHGSSSVYTYAGDLENRGFIFSNPFGECFAVYPDRIESLVKKKP